MANGTGFSLDEADLGLGVLPDRSCAICGYQIASRPTAPSCPMCRSSEWLVLARSTRSAAA